MLIVIPTGTDAPCYHFPVATIGLISLNVVVLVLQLVFPEAAEFFILRHAIFNPITWFSSCCMHAGVGHLVGNMIGLAICGLIIEGKVGWWRLILIYFAIGVSANAFEHLVMFWISERGSLGASGVVFGMLAIIMIWAPENKISFTYFGLLFFYPVFGTFAVSIVGFCFFMIGVEFLTVWFSFFEMSSAMLHLMGVVPGAIVGYVMVKRRMVNCEGYDLMSVHSGREGQHVPTVAQEKQQVELRKQAKSDRLALEEDVLRKVATYIEQGHYEFAWRRFQLLKRENSSLVMPESQYVSIINGLSKHRATKVKSLKIMKSYLRHYTTLRVPIVLNLARHSLVVEGRPRKSLQTMRQIDGETLTGKQLKSAEGIVREAKQKLAEGAIDFADA